MPYPQPQVFIDPSNPNFLSVKPVEEGNYFQRFGKALSGRLDQEREMNKLFQAAVLEHNLNVNQNKGVLKNATDDTLRRAIIEQQAKLNVPLGESGVNDQFSGAFVDEPLVNARDLTIRDQRANLAIKPEELTNQERVNMRKNELFNLPSDTLTVSLKPEGGAKPFGRGSYQTEEPDLFTMPNGTQIPMGTSHKVYNPGGLFGENVNALRNAFGSGQTSGYNSQFPVGSTNDIIARTAAQTTPNNISVKPTPDNQAATNDAEPTDKQPWQGMEKILKKDSAVAAMLTPNIGTGAWDAFKDTTTTIANKLGKFWKGATFDESPTGEVSVSGTALPIPGKLPTFSAPEPAVHNPKLQDMMSRALMERVLINPGPVQDNWLKYQNSGNTNTPTITLGTGQSPMPSPVPTPTFQNKYKKGFSNFKISNDMREKLNLEDRYTAELFDRAQAGDTNVINFLKSVGVQLPEGWGYQRR